MQGDRVAPGVAAEQLGPAGVGPQQAQQDPDGGGLAGPVGAEEPVYLAGPHLQVEPVEGRVGPKRFTSPEIEIAVSIGMSSPPLAMGWLLSAGHATLTSQLCED